MQADKAPPIPVETRAADQAGQALSDLMTGGKVRGRTGALALERRAQGLGTSLSRAAQHRGSADCSWRCLLLENERTLRGPRIFGRV